MSNGDKYRTVPSITAFMRILVRERREHTVQSVKVGVPSGATTKVKDLGTYLDSIHLTDSHTKMVRIRNTGFNQGCGSAFIFCKSGSSYFSQ